MFINKFQYLLAYSEKIGLLMMCLLSKRTMTAIKDGIEGFLVDVNDVDLFHEKLIKYIQEEDLRTKMQVLLKEYIDVKFTCYRFISDTLKK